MNPRPEAPALAARVAAALAGRDRDLSVPAFDPLWREAQRRCAVRSAPVHRHVRGYALAAGLAVAAFLFLLSTGSLQERYIRNATLPPHAVPDPDSIWNAPTDALLRVDSMRYNREYIRFATYDPITMEIRE